MSGNTKSCGCLQKEKTKEASKRYNKYDLTGEYGMGLTSNTNEEFYFDLEDYDKIKDYCWYKDDKGYLSSHKIDSGHSGKLVKMHQLIMEEKWIDHKDNNTLNNRKENLRLCTQQENNKNTSLRKNNKSGVIGVSWSKSKNKWLAQLRNDNINHYLGLYENIEDAIKARLEAEKQYFGEFAPQQHLFEKYLL